MKITEQDLAVSYLLRTYYAKAGVRVDPENPEGSIVEAGYDDVPIGTLEKIEEFGGQIMGTGRREAGGDTYVRVRLERPTHEVLDTIQQAKQIARQDKASQRPDSPRLMFKPENLSRNATMMAFLEGIPDTDKNIKAPRKQLIRRDYDRTIVESRLDKIPEGLADGLKAYGAHKWATRENEDGSTSLQVEFDVPFDQVSNAVEGLLRRNEKGLQASVYGQKPFIILCDERGVLNYDTGPALLRDFAHDMAEQGVRVEFVSVSLYDKPQLEDMGWGDEKLLGNLRHETWHIPDRGERIQRFINKNKDNWAGWIEIKDDYRYAERYKTQEQANLHGIKIKNYGVHDEPGITQRLEAMVREQMGAEFGKQVAMVYNFAEHNAEGVDQSATDLGGKGLGLMNMANQGMPVPPGFVTTTNVCRNYLKTGDLSDELADEMAVGLTKIEQNMGKKFGDAQNPLLLSVRSGAPVSMPGMMETVLNIGINDEIADEMARSGSGQDKGAFAFDCYRRLIESYGAAVNHIDAEVFELSQERALREHGLSNITEADERALRAVVENHKKAYFKATGEVFPQSIWAQLEGANRAVFDSWNSDRCEAYRQANDIPSSLYTAATTQAMVFGNRSERSGSGVLFTRDPNTGERKLTGKWLPKSQGEDVVSGRFKAENLDTLAEKMPDVYEELKQHAAFLEASEKDVQDIEFTIENGRLFMLQTRDAKRSPEAEIRIAAEMTHENIIDKEEAVQRAKNMGIDKLLNMEVDMSAPEAQQATPILSGQAVCSGAVNGAVAFNEAQARDIRALGKIPIIMAEDSLTEDIKMMQQAGGMAVLGGNEASHAAVVARGMGLPYICDLPTEGKIVDKYIEFKGGTRLYLGDEVCLDAMSGRIFEGHLPLKQKDISPELEQIAEWDKQIADETGVSADIYTALERTRQGEPEYENVLQEVVYGRDDDDGSPPWKEHHDHAHER